MKPTSLFMAVIAGIVLAIWWTFRDTTSLHAQATDN